MCFLLQHGLEAMAEKDSEEDDFEEKSQFKGITLGSNVYRLFHTLVHTCVITNQKSEPQNKS